MPFDVVSYVLARRALRGLRLIADVEANASVLTIEGFDKTKTYLLHVFVHNADDNPRFVHVRVDGDAERNYRYQVEHIQRNELHLAFDERPPFAVVGMVPPFASLWLVVFVSCEWFNKTVSRYAISFTSIGGGGPILVAAYSDYVIGDPIPSPYSLTIGNVNGYFDYVRIRVYEVG